MQPNPERKGRSSSSYENRANSRPVGKIDLPTASSGSLAIENEPKYETLVPYCNVLYGSSEPVILSIYKLRINCLFLVLLTTKLYSLRNGISNTITGYRLPWNRWSSVFQEAARLLLILLLVARSSFFKSSFSVFNLSIRSDSISI